MVSPALHRDLETAVRTIQRVVHDAAPGQVSGDQARGLVDLLAEAEKAAASGIARLAPVVVETGSFAKTGHGTASDWLAAVSGSSASAAKGRLAIAGQAAAVPELAEALRGGDLSAAQLKLVTETAEAAPQALGRLLPMMAEGASHQELSDTAARLRAAARSRESERARRARVHKCRHLRWHQDDNGGIRGEFLCDEVAWAKVAPELEADAKARWKAGGGVNGEPLEAHRLDAFLSRLFRHGGRQHNDEQQVGSDSGSRPHSIVLVDAEALRRGTAQGDELCEIDGIGPVSVDAATELLGEGTVQYIVREGVDIRTVTKSSRVLAQRVAAALLVRDRICVVPGCGKRVGLEKDHCKVDYVQGGPTELANLARLCGPHHAQKTFGGWKLAGGPGHWSWIAPPNPPTARSIARARKLAAAKAQAKAKASRNTPRRT